MRTRIRRTLLHSLTRGKIYDWLRGWGYDITPIAKHPPDPIAIHLASILDALKINCVLDVGANEGQFAAMLRRIGYAGQIISFEPVHANFATLGERHGQDRLWRGCDFALGANEGSSEIQVTRHSVFSSFLSPNSYSHDRFGADSSVSSTQTVQIKRLDQIIDTLIGDIPQPRIFLKMDTQGFDLEVLRGAQGCLDRILGLQTELSIQPIYENMPSHIEMLTALHAGGYVVTGMFPINADELLRPVEFDCVAVRAEA